jgi:hypothetical protein
MVLVVRIPPSLSHFVYRVARPGILYYINDRKKSFRTALAAAEVKGIACTKYVLLAVGRRRRREKEFKTRERERERERGTNDQGHIMVERLGNIRNGKSKQKQELHE